MTLDVHEVPGQDFNTLTACPACGYEFQPEERRHVHLSEHSPEDFGLYPLGETNEEAQKPLWGAEEFDFGADPEGWSE